MPFLDPSDERWLAFTTRSTAANIFHHPLWETCLADCYGYRGSVFAVLNEYSRILAGLPLMQTNSVLTGRRWVSLPFSDHCIPLYSNEAALRQLTKELVHFSNDRNNPRIELRGKYSPDELIHTHSNYILHTNHWQ